MRLARIGFDHLIGALADRVEALVAQPEHVHRLSRLTADILERRIADQPDPVLIDIHNPSEVSLGRIPAPATSHPRLLDNLEN